MIEPYRLPNLLKLDLSPFLPPKSPHLLKLDLSPFLPPPNRATEAPPGPQAIWIGLRRMFDYSRDWLAFGPETSS